MLTDAVLPDFIAGKESAFKIVFHELYKPIWAFIYRIVEDAAEAEDGAVISFHELFKRHNKINTTGELIKFTYAIARNWSLNCLKRQKRYDFKKERFLKSLNEDDFILFQVKTDIVGRLYEMIELLPTQCKQVVKLMLKDIPDTEIAKALNISVPTVQVQRHRAIKSLKLKMLNNENRRS